MFETADKEKPHGVPWGIVAGLVALAVLLAGGYLLITAHSPRPPINPPEWGGRHLEIQRLELREHVLVPREG